MTDIAYKKCSQKSFGLANLILPGDPLFLACYLGAMPSSGKVQNANTNGLSLERVMPSACLDNRQTLT